jgi:hypothetical protein
LYFWLAILNVLVFLVTPEWPLLLVILMFLIITDTPIFFVILVFLAIPVLLGFLVTQAGHSECSGVFGNSRMDVTPCHSGNHRNSSQRIANTNKNCELPHSQTGGQRYSDTSPFSIPWSQLH